MGLENLHRTASFSLAELGIVDAPPEEDFGLSRFQRGWMVLSRSQLGLPA